MKNPIKLLFVAALFFASTFIYAQAPEGFNYQAAIRDGSGEILANTNVNLRISVITDNVSGTVQYREVQDLTTNAYGLVNHVVGSGTVDNGSFSGITWASGDKFLKVEVSVDGGPYNDMGTQQLVSVPFAIHAGNAVWEKSGNNINYSSGNVGIGIATPIQKLEVAGNISVFGKFLGKIGSNLVYGENALQGGNTNTAIGDNTLKDNSSGYDNTALGNSAGINNTTGFRNTAIGVRALEGNTTGRELTAIGHFARPNGNNLRNSIAIGHSAVVDANNKARIGNGALSSIGGQVNWTSFSDGRVKDNVQETVVGLEFINALRPVTYNYDVNKQEQLLGLNETGKWDGKYDIEKIRFSGFIAQEVENAAESVGYNFSGIDNSGEVLGLRYAEFTVPLVKAVQEQQAQIETLKKENQKLKETNQAFLADLNAIKAQLGMGLQGKK